MDLQLPFGVWVDAAVAGRCAMSLNELKRILGPTSYAVWRKLLYCRDANGHTRVTRRTLAGPRVGKTEWHPLTDRQIHNSLKRLRDAKLLTNVAWVRSKTNPKQPVMLRQVRGAIVTDPERGRMAVVPKSAHSSLLKMATWGGKRRVRPGELGQDVPAETVRKLQPSLDQDVPHKGADQDVPDNRTLSSVGQVGLGEKDSLSAARRGGSFSFGEDVGGGTGFGLSTTQHRSDERYFHPAIPPFPTHSVVRPARIPNPPKIEPDLDNEDLAEMLATAYRAATAALCTTKSWALRGDVRRSKHYDRLVKAGHMMRTHDIAPAAWVAWSIDVWSRNEDKKAPPIPWMFSADRIERRRGWFRNESSSFSGGRLIAGPKYKELSHRYMRMRRALINSVEPVENIVGRYFPGRLYEQLVAEARTEAARIQEDQRDKVRRGVFLWG